MIEAAHLPTTEQELLLQAALWRGGDARAAWQRWRSAVDLDGEIDEGSFRLLPLLFRNLTEQAIEDPLLGRLKGVHRRAWYQNQLLFDRVDDLLRALPSCGIEVALLNGAAMILTCYDDGGLRPLDHFDLLVRRPDASAAMRLLMDLGWKPSSANLEARLEVRDAVTFGNEDGMQVNLHAHLFPECCNDQASLPFWNEAVAAVFKGHRVSVLAPSDQLFHLCVQGMRWNPVAAISWAADTWMLMNMHGESIDWDRLLFHARRLRYRLVLRSALRYLSERMRLGIPSRVLASLSHTRIGAFERVDFWFRTQPPRPTLWMATLDPVLRHVRGAGQTGFLSKAARFPRFLRSWWELPSVWQIPIAVFRKGVRKFSRKNRPRAPTMQPR